MSPEYGFAPQALPMTADKKRPHAKRDLGFVMAIESPEIFGPYETMKDATDLVGPAYTTGTRA
jgi:hypothetical protein